LSLQSSPQASLFNSEVVGAIALTLVEIGRFERAVQLTQIIADDKNKLWTLRHIAIALAEAGEFDRALQIARTIVDDKFKGHAVCDRVTDFSLRFEIGLGVTLTIPFLGLQVGFYLVALPKQA